VTFRQPVLSPVHTAQQLTVSENAALYIHPSVTAMTTEAIRTESFAFRRGNANLNDAKILIRRAFSRNRKLC